MKILMVILSVVDVLMLGSTLLCGFWIRSHATNGVPDPSSVSFHGALAVATCVVVLITIALAVFRPGMS